MFRMFTDWSRVVLNTVALSHKNSMEAFQRREQFGKPSREMCDNQMLRDMVTVI